MKFFIPHADSPEQTYKAIKDFAVANGLGAASPKRIFRLKYHHEGKDYQAEVGKVHGRLREEVIAIFETYVYLICTANYGVLRGNACMVGFDEMEEIEEFEKE